MNYIEELYFGNLEPSVRHGSKNPRYRKMQKVLCENEEILFQTLSDDTLRKFHEILDANSEILGIECTESFKIGFITGARIVMDCFADE